MNGKTLRLFLSCLLAASPCWASGAGTTGADILNLGVGARAIAMGEAYTSLADDTSSLYWNPAGLALLDQAEASFMYDSYLQGLSESHAAVGVPLENGGVAGGIDYLSFGSIAGADSQGNPTGNVDAYSGVGSLGSAWLGETWTAGATVKGIRTSLADVSANGVAFDLGGDFIYPHEVLGGATFRLGAAVRNLGTGMKFLQQNDPFPMQFRVGASLLRLVHDRLTLSTDFGKTQGDNGAFYGGGEYKIGPVLALRAGYAGTSAEGSGLRAGIGLRYRALSFDYAYAPYGDLGMTHRYELKFRFGDIRPLLTPEEKAMLRRAKVAIAHQRFDEAVLLLDSLNQLVPTYRPVKKLLAYALKESEDQERFARQPNPTNPNVSVAKHSATLSDLDDVEYLLKLGDTDSQVAQKSKKSAQENGR